MSFDAAAGVTVIAGGCVPCIKYPGGSRIAGVRSGDRISQEISGSQGCGPETGYLRKFINILSANSCGQAGS